jgi:hypothetical protein
MVKNCPERFSTALHEAGHAVIARHFGQSICEVRLYEEEGQYHGQTKFCPEQKLTLCSKDEVVVLLAGFAAEQHYNPAALDFEKEFWASDCTRYASDRSFLCIKLQKLTESEIANNPDDNCVLDRAVAPLFDEAKKLVATHAHWRAIESLAKELCVSLNVTGKSAMETIDSIISTDMDSV